MTVSLGNIVTCLNSHVRENDLIHLQEARDLASYFVKDIEEAVEQIDPALLKEIRSTDGSVGKSVVFLLLQYIFRDGFKAAPAFANWKKFEPEPSIQPEHINSSSAGTSNDVLVSNAANAVIFENKVVLRIEKLFSSLEETVKQSKPNCLSNDGLQSKLQPIAESIGELQSLLQAKQSGADSSEDFKRMLQIGDSNFAECKSLINALRAEVLEGSTNIVASDKSLKVKLSQFEQSLAGFQGQMSNSSFKLDQQGEAIRTMLFEAFQKHLKFHENLTSSYREQLSRSKERVNTLTSEKGKLACLVERQKRLLDSLRQELAKGAESSNNAVEQLLKVDSKPDLRPVDELQEVIQKMLDEPKFKGLTESWAPLPEQMEVDVWIQGPREFLYDETKSTINSIEQMREFVNFLLTANSAVQQESNRIQFQQVHLSTACVNELSRDDILDMYSSTLIDVSQLDTEFRYETRDPQNALALRRRFANTLTCIRVLYVLAEQLGYEKESRKISEKSVSHMTDRITEVEKRLLETEQEWTELTNRLKQKLEDCVASNTELRVSLEECAREKREILADHQEKERLLRENQSEARDTSYDRREQTDWEAKIATLESKLEKCHESKKKIASTQRSTNSKLSRTLEKLSESESKNRILSIENLKLKLVGDILQAGAERHIFHANELARRLDPNHSSQMKREYDEFNTEIHVKLHETVGAFAKREHSPEEEKLSRKKVRGSLHEEGYVASPKRKEKFGNDSNETTMECTQQSMSTPPGVSRTVETRSADQGDLPNIPQSGAEQSPDHDDETRS
ncbi:hypothetical protein HDE_12498 [Halotydeus destructor]|nr:hypothetical protein HDE_12498 [Halotydeus destructor]